MYIGQTVTLVTHGHEKAVTVQSITGPGPSGFKILKLDGKNVPHEKDKETGSPFWREGAPGEAKAAAAEAEAQAEAEVEASPKPAPKRARTTKK